MNGVGFEKVSIFRSSYDSFHPKALESFGLVSDMYPAGIYAFSLLVSSKRLSYLSIKSSLKSASSTKAQKTWSTMSQSQRLLNKVAIVTGASSGLGRAIAIRYAQEGAKVVCADISPTARSQEEAQITTHDAIVSAGGQAIFVQTDVGDAKQMEDLVEAAVREFGRLDM